MQANRAADSLAGSWTTRRRFNKQDSHQLFG